MTAPPRHSLRRLLGQRLIGAGLVALLSLLVVLGIVYTVQQGRLQELWLREARTHFERQTQRVEADWTRQADLLRAQIEFAGMLDDPDPRSAALRFTAFFASQGGESTFTHVQVRDPAGRIVASYATRSGSADLSAERASGWRLSPAEGVLYRVLHAPVRLGRTGRGEMQLLVPLNNSLVDSIAFPEAGVSLHWREHDDLAVSASYHARQSRAEEMDASRLEARFRWNDAPDSPELHVYRTAPRLLPLSDLLTLAGLAALGGTLLAWLVLGRWARQHVRRIDALAGSVDRFAGQRHTADALATALERDAVGGGLELDRLGSGLASMMRTTEAAVAETAAARDHLATLNATLEQRVVERTRELEQARDEALAAVRARQRIMAGVSHELRTPLMGLLGSLELVEPDRLSPDQRRLIEAARRSGQSLRAVVNDVLDYSRLEAVGASLHEEPFRPDELCADVVSSYAAMALGRGLHLGCECDEAAHQTVIGDAARLRQVLLNLVGNALKFTDRGGVTLRVAAVPGPGQRLRFEVQDSGIGMNEALIERLFNPFVQADDGSVASRGGTGLGLSIAQRLVVAMGGRIVARSVLQQGSTFSFDLPLRVQDPPSASRALQTGAPDATHATPGPLRGRVLLVDDNAVNRMIGGEMLRRMGMQVEEAENGLLALEALRRMPADLVLMDQQMPVLDGIAATQRIRQGDAGPRAVHVPIVAVTAEALEGDAERCRAAGMNDHLSKPFTQNELRAVVERWMATQAAAASAN